MSTLVVIGYNDPFKAEDIRLKFLRCRRSISLT